jgi:hypothetical protein
MQIARKNFGGFHPDDLENVIRYGFLHLLLHIKRSPTRSQRCRICAENNLDL